MQVNPPGNRSASKHGRRTFLYSAIRELVCSGQLWVRASPEAAPQLQGRIARAFSSNSLVNTMEMTAAIQYILTGAQSLGSRDYYKKSPVTILGLAGVLFCENEQAQTNWIIVCSKKILTWMLWEARGGLKALVGDRVQPDYYFITWFFVLFCFFQPGSCFPWQAML